MGISIRYRHTVLLSVNRDVKCSMPCRGDTAIFKHQGSSEPWESGGDLVALPMVEAAWKMKHLKERTKKGHDIAIFDILSRVEHRNCARYMFANWSGRKLGKSYEFDFWQIVKCMTERGWEELCTTVEKKDKDAYDNLMKNSPKMWTRAFWGTTCKSDIIDNNPCESFNSNIIEARFKSIIIMLEDIRTKMMTRIIQKRKLYNRWKRNYGPLVKAKLDANKKDCVEWQLIWNGENGCELRKGRYQYTVDLSQSICSCRSWQISGILCAHACAAMYHLGLQLDDYLNECHHIKTYKKAYSFPMQPINGPHDWPKTGIELALPPIERKMPGRPKKNRRIAKDEPKRLKPDHLSRKGLLMTCTQCGQHGHNKGFCTKGNKHVKQVQFCSSLIYIE
ncbi:uncharacterized protein [Gossypium hirsutum]|uniref:SWIM-type domain-containing protein n=1 Tax=Gossypium hirsutum TaxID=3635 RepID=A0ABM3A1A3_GOSHI|nr:uncharacterized protein LOC121217202 [Gossypium hirsutum]